MRLVGRGATEMTHSLAGKRVLIVEDDNILAMNLLEELAAEGAKAIGPAGTVDGALKAIKNADVDGAIVDINLGGSRLSRSSMLWRTGTSHSSSRQGTWSQVTYRLVM
jgi:DNA-binding NarL/FixJ family response regulator